MNSPSDTAPETIEDVLADARDKAETLRHFGHAQTAEAIHAILDRLVATPELRALLTWHDESGAAVLGDRAPGWYRARFADWVQRRLARLQGRRRQYREVVIEYATDRASIAADAEATAARDRVA